LFEQEVSWDDKYEQFVQKLGDNAKDPKTRSFINAGLKDGYSDDDKFSFSSKDLAVKDLVPTQNEVDIDKSLAFPMKKDPGKFVTYNSGDGPFTLGSPIVTYKGKYVIDGHHRWSQLYACNADATIKAIDIDIANLEPLDVLKAVQASIAITTGDVPVQSVQGTNLLTVDDATLSKWIDGVGESFFDAIKADKAVMDKMKSVTKSDEDDVKKLVKEYIIRNVKVMQANSQPVPGAPKRNFMPQTDNVDWVHPLKTGQIDIAHPHAKGLIEKNDDVIIERWQKLAGILKD
jgi:hypothetical protein